MNPKKSLENWIRGWLPKTPNLPSNKANVADAKNKFSNPYRWGPLWLTLVGVAVIFVVINYFLFHYPSSSIIGGMAIALLGIVVAYYIRGWLPKEPNMPSLQRTTEHNHVQSGKVKFPISMMLFLSLFIISSITGFLEGNAMAALWLWFSCIIGLFLTLDILVSRGKELNEKTVAGLGLAVTNLGGMLTNLYIFSMPTSSFARIFSLSVLALVNVPLLIALLAYVWGKKEQARKLYRLVFFTKLKV